MRLIRRDPAKPVYPAPYSVTHTKEWHASCSVRAHQSAEPRRLVVLNTHFAVQNGQLVAITSLGNQVLGTAPAQVTQPTPGTCSVLNLVLGPLHLDLLGLIIDLNGGTDANGNALPVTITAQPGTLLGGLVCDIANLLNASPPNLSGIANLLNLLVAILRI